MRGRLHTPLLLALCFACGTPSGEPHAGEAPEAAREAVGPVPAAWVAERVSGAEARMGASAGGRLVAAAIEAHGGLEAWLSAGTVRFTFDYRPVGAPERRMNTRSEVDLWSGRARQQELGEPGESGLATFAFDGEEAWMSPGPEAFPSSARFWATTPYYFIGIPFVLADPGVRYETLEDETIDGRSYRRVRASFADGTGDSSDDYYILCLDPDSHRVAAIRYIVAYPGFFEAGQHSPEKLMRYEDYREVGELIMPHAFRTFRQTDDGAWDALATQISAGDYVFGETWPESHFARPEDGVVSEVGHPSR